MTPNLDASVFTGIKPDIGLPESLWITGLAWTAATAVALKKQRTVLSYSSLLVALIISVIGASGLLKIPPPQHVHYSNFIDYKPVCANQGVQVCLHPAYAKLLPKTSSLAGKIYKPLKGIPGAPTKIVQGPYGPNLTPSSTYGNAATVDLRGGYTLISYSLAHNLTQGDIAACKFEPGSEPIQQYVPEYEARYTLHCMSQDVIANWLLQRAGVNPDSLGESPPVWDQEAQAALSRFSNLSPAEQHEWLVKNFKELRSGKFTAEDVP